MHIVTVANRKGGVGRSSAAVHLGAAFARHGLNVVVVDLDSQANATTILREAGSEKGSTAEVLVHGSLLTDILVDTVEPGLLLAPASGRLAAAQMMLTDKLGRERKLAEAMRGLEADVVLIDTAPEGHWGLANALVASTHVLIPFTPDAAALHGMRAVEQLVEDIKRASMNAQLRRLGYLQVAMDARLNATEGVRDYLEHERGELLMETAIRANARFLSTVGSHRTVFDLEKGTDRKGSIDYTNAAHELWNRLHRTKVAA